MHSIWQTDVTLPSFPPLDGDRQTDVLVIGGGLTGLLCAYFLQQAGIPCLLAEADTICSGVTQNTTAKVTSQHGLHYASLLRRFGAQRAQLYLQANQAALAEFRRLSQQFPFDLVPEDPMSMPAPAVKNCVRSCRPWTPWAGKRNGCHSFRCPFLSPAQ